MPRLRFPQAARLSRASEFARLKRDGRAFHGKLMILSVLAAEAEAETRIGFITSKRVGGAVQRNRVRRRLREIIRALRPRLRRGFWVVVIARQSAAQADLAMLQADCLQLAHRGALLLPPCS